METTMTKEKFDELMKIEGMVRGATLQSYWNYILEQEGQEGIRKMEDEIKSLGYLLKYGDIRKMEFYPLGIQAVTFELMREFFNYDKQRFQEIGKFVSKVSLILRLFTKYFVSGEKVMKEIPEMWRKNYTTGELKVVDYKEGDNRLILRLENFRLHIFHGQVLVGYFHTIVGMLGGRDTVEIKETKSPFFGDDYYEFFLKWPPPS